MLGSSARLRRRELVFGGLCALPLGASAGFVDPLDAPAAMRSVPGRRPLLAVTTVGRALVGVGSRGLIVRSENRGQTWEQSQVPVQSDLLAVQFVSERLGWAVGHDGVVLHSSDGGRSWGRQLDGRAAGSTFQSYYASAGTADEVALAQTQKNQGNGPVLPYLDLWFEDERKGYIVGSFGQIAATQDGGRTWEPWLHRIDNPDQLNFNAIRSIAGQLWIAGERGRLFRLDRTTGRFQAQDTGYAGSFFGLAGHADALLAFGLRGVVYRRDAAGAGRWVAVPMPAEQSITAGLFDPGAGFVLVDAAGQILLGGSDGLRWTAQAPPRPMRAAGLALLDRDTVALAALDGAHVLSLPPQATRS
ncbi:MAG TPA: YCF48-related protein [Methylibium sp.]|nr:YCF48-related protein [Methylibium sp.]